MAYRPYHMGNSSRQLYVGIAFLCVWTSPPFPPDMVREELLRRQLLAAEDNLLLALKNGTLETFLLEWATLQETVIAAAELDQLSNDLLLLNDDVCQGVENIVQSCLNVEEEIHKAFNAQDILSDFVRMQGLPWCLPSAHFA
jgi:hypothetical protein